MGRGCLGPPPGTQSRSALPLASCVALDQSLHLSEPHLAHFPRGKYPCLGSRVMRVRRRGRGTWQAEALGDGGRLLGSAGAHPRAAPPTPTPRRSSGPVQPDGGSGEMPRSCSSWSILRSLLFPLLPGAMWWLQVSAPGRGSEPDRVLPRCLTPSPLLPRGLSPTVLTPSSGSTASAGRGRGQVPKEGFAVGAGHLLAIWRKWGAGVGPPIVRAQRLPAQAPASASLHPHPHHGRQHPRVPSSSHHCWG